jgi:ABC-type microcin C transport system duplicated ATPase subunit YejF
MRQAGSWRATWSSTASTCAGLSPEACAYMRGNRMAMIFQDPMMTLNPVLRIDVQMIEAILAHDDVSHAAARERARETLVKVGIPSPDERLEGVSASILRRHAPACRLSRSRC